MRYDHRCHVIETGGWLSRGNVDPSDIDDEIAGYGAAGYRMVSAIPVSDGNVGTKRIALFFERELRD